MPTTKENMQSARAYIQRNQWDDARRVLNRVDHPKAKDWLVKIDKHDPPNNVNKPLNLIVVWLCVLMSMVIAVFPAKLVHSFDRYISVSEMVVFIVWLVGVFVLSLLSVNITKRWRLP